MERWILFAFVSSLALISVVSSESKVDLQITQNRARVGEEVTLSCEITELSGSRPTILISKIVKNITGSNIREVVSANLLLNEDYESSTRFSVDERPLDSTAWITLTMKNVQYEDSGRYECGVDKDADVGSVTFEVYRNTEYLAFHFNGTEVEEHATIDLQESDPMPLGCYASRALPVPQMHINVGNRDITTKFTSEHHMVPVCVSEPGCLLSFYYNASLYNSEYKAGWNENGQQLRCKAIIEEEDGFKHDFEIKETYVVLNVTHRPRINCTKTYQAYKGGQKTVRCPVYSNPELYKEVEFSTEDYSFTLKPGESKDGITFKYEASTDVTKPGNVQVTWTNVQQRDFRNYRIKANNALGFENFEFSLKEGDDGQPGNPGGAAVNKLSVLSLIMVAVMAVINH